jgi:nucleotide-binding universal stress UspA family protein
MGTFTKILVADDLSRENKSEPTPALKIASDIAEALNSELCLIHAYTVPNIRAPGDSMSLIEVPYVDEMTKCLESEAQNILAQKPNLHLISRIEKGNPVNTILNDVATDGFQMIVLGTHGRKGLRRALLGSVAEEIIRLSPVPVLTVNPHSIASEEFNPKKILVPLDFTANQQITINLASRFAIEFGATLVFMHVVEEWVYPIVQSASLLAGGVIMTLERDLRELGNLRYTQLEAVTKPLRESGFDVQTKLVERASSVGRAVVEEAIAGNYDLVVMGHRHASRLEYAIEGSVSRHVVREAHCPVLTIAS